MSELPATRRAHAIERSPDRAPRIDVPGGPLQPPAIRDLCARADVEIDHAPGALVFDARRVDEPDLSTVEAVARLALTARRRRREVRIERLPRGLVDLLDLCGLADLIAREQARDRNRIKRSATAADRARDGPGGRTSVEAVGQSEQREEPLRVQEEGDPGDPVAVDLEDLQ